MKKLLFTAGTVAVLALASCSNDEIENLNPTASGLIRYNAVVKTTTRANTLWESNSHPDFTVYAKESAGGTYIKGDLVKWDSNSEIYTYNQRYWPENALDFIAYSGTNAYKDANNTHATSVSFNDNNDGKLVLSDIAISPWADQQDDMLYAKAENQQCTTGDSQDVILNFRHALAQLNFRFVNNNPNINVEVDEVRICNIKNVAKSLTISSSTDGQYVVGGTNPYPDDANLCSWDIAADDATAQLANIASKVTDGKTIKNGAFASLSGKITLNGTAQQLTSTAVRPVAGDYFELVSTTGEGENWIAGAKAQQAADFAALQAGAASLTAPTAVQEPATDASAEDIKAYQKYLGAKAQYDADADESVYTQDLIDKCKADFAAYNTKANSDKLANAVYVLPQETKAAELAAVNWTAADGKQYNVLRDVTGMYFLIKCRIQNIADPENGVSDDDVYLFGKDGAAYIYVPLVQSDYKPATGDNGEEETAYIDEWKAGRKYIYTFFFGERGSNGGTPVTDPENPGVDPDPDPDDPSVIDQNDPTLRLITYSATSISVDDYADGANDDQEVDSTQKHNPSTNG
jgi:hypothetical protein